jgi:hypothetical protein
MRLVSIAFGTQVHDLANNSNSVDKQPCLFNFQAQMNFPKVAVNDTQTKGHYGIAPKKRVVRIGESKQPHFYIEVFQIMWVGYLSSFAGLWIVWLCNGKRVCQ